MESQNLSRKGIFKRSREGRRVLSQPSTLFCLFNGLLTGFILLSFSLSPGLFFPSLVFASNHSSEVVQNPTQPFSKENRYQPYVEVGGIKYFNQESKAAGMYDLFLPLSSSSSNQASNQSTMLFFSDIRIFDRTGSWFEGNVHLGYRVILPETNTEKNTETRSGKNQLFGVYASFDRRKSEKKHFFNQITLGGNLYTPIGKKKRLTSDALPSEPQPISWKEERSLGRVIEYTGTITTTKTKHVVEKALYGVDAEVGHAFNEQLTGYAGGKRLMKDVIDYRS